MAARIMRIAQEREPFAARLDGLGNRERQDAVPPLPSVV